MGIPCVTMSSGNVKSTQNLAQENPHIPMDVDLENLQLHCGHYSTTIKIDSGARKMLTSGQWDSCGQLTQNVPQIKETAHKLPYLAW